MYTIDQYLNTISREIQQRERTYPKIRHKKAKEAFKGAVDQLYSTQQAQDIYDKVILEISEEQNFQIKMLEDCTRVLSGSETSKEHLEQIHAELIREGKMRKKMYGFFVLKRILSADTAEYEQLIWNALITYFKSRYLSHELSETA